ncbi:MAG: Y-family DNA polymerase [Myxococcota bacterium]
MFGLIDCNNFYVSCERLFRPDLLRRPVAVLSNNDGCVVARSNEVKALGVPMGAPFFKVRDLLRAHRAAVFSSNYTLYGDLSGRVMRELGQEASAVEVYSIDEAFIRLDHSDPSRSVQDGFRLRGAINQRVGVPVSVGLAPTKTLAKVANRVAKRTDGMHVLSDPASIQGALERLETGDVWGIGRRYSAMLAAHGIHTAADFVRLPEGWVQQKMTRVGVVTHRELRGVPCRDLELRPPPRRSMVYSRSFKRPVSDRASLREAIATFAAGVSHRLRRHQLHASWLRVFLIPPRNADAPSRSSGGGLDHPTADAREMIGHAWRLLDKIHTPDFRCGKAGVMAVELSSNQSVQQTLFSTPSNPKVMAVLDDLNRRFGRGTVRLAAQGTNKKAGWRMRQRARSPRYTTRWNELCHVDVDQVYRASTDPFVQSLLQGTE